MWELRGRLVLLHALPTMASANPQSSIMVQAGIHDHHSSDDILQFVQVCPRMITCSGNYLPKSCSFEWPPEPVAPAQVAGSKRTDTTTTRSFQNILLHRHTRSSRSTQKWFSFCNLYSLYCWLLLPINGFVNIDPQPILPFTPSSHGNFQLRPAAGSYRIRICLSYPVLFDGFTRQSVANPSLNNLVTAKMNTCSFLNQGGKRV